MLEKLAEPKRLDPRIKRTRELLVKALMELMQEKSFQAITVQDIAERATINRVTFYAHFEDKSALLEYMMAVAFQERVRSRIPAESTLTPGNLRRRSPAAPLARTDRNHFQLGHLRRGGGMEPGRAARDSGRVCPSGSAAHPGKPPTPNTSVIGNQ